MDNIILNQSRPKKKLNEENKNSTTHREERGGVDGEERDLINLGAEESKL